MTLKLLRQPDGQVRLGDLLIHELSSGRWESFRAAVAFAKSSGVRYIADALQAFASRGAVRVSVGIDLFGTSREALADLLEILGDASGRVFVFHNTHPMRPVFHPKLYLFGASEEALLIAGSGNLTGGGLFTNYEAGVCATLRRDREDDRALLAEVGEALDAWSNPDSGLAVPLSAAVLDRLVEDGLVLPERAMGGEEELPAAIEGEGTAEGETDRATLASSLFGSVAVPPPPRPPRRAAHPFHAAGEPRGFLMTLLKGDAGFGQTTEGTSRRSPEVFIPLAARNVAPGFWGWPDAFVEDPTKPGKMDRRGVRMRIGGDETTVNMMTWPDKHDFRLRSEALRSAGRIGDILRIERVDGEDDFDYYVEIVPRGTSDYERRLAQCTEVVRNSSKRFGYY